jgi:cytochrome c
VNALGRVLGVVALAVAGIIGACGEMNLDGTVEQRAQPEDAKLSRPEPVSSSSAPTHAMVEDGRALVAKHECNRCHEGTGLAAVPPQKNCVQCHDQIATGSFAAPPAALAKWKPHVAELRFVPSLARAGAMLKPAWIASYLQAPHDVRPALHAEMPRLDVDRSQADAIARYLASMSRVPASASEDAQPTGDAERGRRLFREKQCGTCHAFTGSGMTAPLTKTTDEARNVLAPDLAFARARLRRDLVAGWIRDPASIAADATMPKQDVTRREADDLVAFLFDAPLEPPAEKPAPARLPLLERPVRYQEVADRVLHKICWHCHSQPDYARGDGGPGNTGGFGFAGRGLDLSSYESIAGGYRNAAGERVSVFFSAMGTGVEGAEPMLVAVLLAREQEHAGRMGTVRGMPLGLPPISPEDIQLVASWVAQGHPR